MAVYTQENRLLAITTPLGPDVLLAAGLHGREEISRLFHFQIDVLAEIGAQVPFDRLLGQPIAVRLELSGGQKRHFSGLCSSVAHGESDDEFTHYSLEMVPSLWLLTKRARSRIFQHLSVPEILGKVLDGLDVVYEIQGTFHSRDFCVQYRESDFAFASRLMEEEGIYYFFRHSESGHQLVLANTPQSHPRLPHGGDRVLYEQIRGGNRPEDRVHQWEKRQMLVTSKVTLRDHCFEMPDHSLEASEGVQESVRVGGTTHRLSVVNGEPLEKYDFPGAYAQRFDGVDRGGAARPDELRKIFEDNQRTAALRAQQEATPSIVLQGAGNCRHFTAGFRFTLATQDAAQRRGLEADGTYVLTSVDHDARMHGSYRSKGEIHYQNTFTCLPIELPFRPTRTTPKPTVQGSQTAVVVGNAGEEVFCDKYGRVKVQFHWDREGRKNADSSCWVRVGTVWAGKRWGVVHVPRVGQEVIVDFLEGDPDQPIIIGSVYNAEQMPPYLGEGLDGKHAHNPHVSGIKTNSTPGGKGYNELRFDDSGGREQVFLHAEKDLDVRVKSSRREAVLGDQHLSVGVEGKKQGGLHEEVHGETHLRTHADQHEHVGGNQHLLVGEAKGGGDQHVVLKGTRRELIEGQAHQHVKGSLAQKVEGQTSLTFVAGRKEKVTADSHLHVTNDRREKVDGSQSLTVGQNHYEKVGQVHAVEAGREIHLKAGTKVIIESGVQLTLAGPGGFIDISPGGITIQGTLVKLNVGGSAGTGSGSQPQAPEEPATVEPANAAAPVAPAPADDSSPGSRSAP